MDINISKSFDEIVLYKDLKLKLIEHKINVILGPSGCGKTTLLKCMASLLPFDGSITKIGDKMSFVFQEDRLFPYLTVFKNLKLIYPDNELIDSYLSLFSVLDLKHKYPKELSGGERQRIAIIRAFLTKANYILMDEPFKSLDYHLKYSIIDVLKQIQTKTQTTIILVTHDLDIALYLGHHIHVLSKKVTKLIKSFSNPYVNQELTNDSVQYLNELKNLIN